MMRKDRRLAFIFLCPLALSILLFQLYPIFLNGFYSLLNWNGLTKTANFIGLDNYIQLFEDSLFWNAVGNSLLFAVLGTILQVGISFGLAALCEFAGFKKGNWIRLLFILPVAATSAVVGIVFKTLFAYEGPVNGMISLLGFAPVNWLADPVWAFVLILLVSVWKETGTLFIYWMAGFSSVPAETLEAAKLDGASDWQLLRHMCLPVMKPILVMCASITFINCLKAFDLIQTLTGGGPYYATDVLSTFIYQTAFTGSFGSPKLSYACAAAIVILLVASGLYAVKRIIQKVWVRT